MDTTQTLRVGIAQLRPVWLNRTATLDKMLTLGHEAAAAGAGLLVFGEAVLPGYPFWLDFTDGARFNSPVQKDIHAYYLQQAVCISEGHLQPLCDLAANTSMAIMTGTIERAADRGGHSLYCSLVYIDATGHVANVHRKLMPTYEERLCWSPGDGHGLRTFPLGPFTLGGLNCWENWMPLPRAALYALGEDMHIALWPGNPRNTELLTRTLAQEGRSYVISVCGLMDASLITDELPHADLMRTHCPDAPARGGSCIARPNGEWLVAPLADAEQLIIADLDHREVLQERQNFDPSGHYSRPDVTQLTVNRTRQSVLKLID